MLYLILTKDWRITLFLAVAVVAAITMKQLDNRVKARDRAATKLRRRR